MKTHISTKILVVFAGLLCIGGGYPTCKCPNAGEDMHQTLMKMLRVRRVEIVTNVWPETGVFTNMVAAIDGPPTNTDQGMSFKYKFIPAQSIGLIWVTNYVTNFVIGTAAKDLFRAEALP